MWPHIHRSTQKRIHKLFSQGISSKEKQKLLVKLGQCSRCAKHYQAYADLEKSLCATENILTPFDIDRGFSWLQEELAQTNASLKKENVVSLQKWTWSLAAASSLAILLLLLLLRPTSDLQRKTLSAHDQLMPVEFVDKGIAPRPDAQVGIRIFKVKQTDLAAKETQTLSSDDWISFSITCVDLDYKYLNLLGVSESGAVFWFYPDPKKEKEYKIQRYDVDVPLGDGFLLASLATKGVLKIKAVFSKEAIEPDWLETHLDPQDLKDSKIVFLEHSIEITVK